jgi:peptidyl-tRNA hydrolase
MEDPKSPETIAARASQEDPIVMYLIMRESLGMSLGKACAQSGHVTMMMHIKYRELLDDNEMAKLCGWEPSNDPVRLELYKKWLDSSFRKVTLTADDKEWAKVKVELSADDIVIVEDAGLTEVPAGSETFIAVWPMHRSQRPRILKKLQAVK